MTGRCPDCGATPRVDELKDPPGDLPLVTSLFPHSVRCAGRDESAKTLLKEHYTAAAGRTAEERLKLASVATRSKTGVAPDIALPMSGAGALSIAVGLLEEVYRHGEFCGHLRAEPAQTSHVQIAERTWRCDECQLHRGQQLLKTGEKLPGDEEFRCDLCRGLDLNIQPLVIRVDHCVMRGGACADCMTKYTEDGAHEPDDQ